jgi:hypothetical protein
MSTEQVQAIAEISDKLVEIALWKNNPCEVIFGKI